MELMHRKNSEGQVRGRNYVESMARHQSKLRMGPSGIQTQRKTHRGGRIKKIKDEQVFWSQNKKGVKGCRSLGFKEEKENGQRGTSIGSQKVTPARTYDGQRLETNKKQFSWLAIGLSVHRSRWGRNQLFTLQKDSKETWGGKKDG